MYRLTKYNMRPPFDKMQAQRDINNENLSVSDKKYLVEKYEEIKMSRIQEGEPKMTRKEFLSRSVKIIVFNISERLVVTAGLALQFALLNTGRKR